MTSQLLTGSDQSKILYLSPDYPPMCLGHRYSRKKKEKKKT